MKDTPTSVGQYFDREAGRFDAIYDQKKPFHQRLIDRLFRGVVLERFRLVMNAAGAPGRSLLDVGCGSGRYGLEFARRGARRCLGLDLSPPMLEIARREAERLDVAAVCEWRQGEWLASAIEGEFDIVLAMGYFDYIEDPAPHLERMIARTTDRLFASFPKRWTLRTLSRKLRFLAAGGFVRFYSRGEVLRLFARHGRPECLSLIDLGRDLIAVYDAGAARGAKRGAGTNRAGERMKELPGDSADR